MKKSIFLFCLLLTGLTHVSNAQDRQVVWVPGLLEDSTFWNYYAAKFFVERQIVSVTPSYDTKAGVTAVADLVKGNITQPNNIVIGHSLGGDAVRDVDRRYRGTIKGFISVGSPLDGAHVVNSLNDGTAYAAINRGLQQLLKGPNSELIPLPIVSGWIVSQVVNALDQYLLQPLLTPNNLGGKSADDLAEGSPFLQAFTDYQTPTPVIAIYGNENSPIHWRLLSSALKQPDNFVVNIADQAGDVYNAFYLSKLALIPFTFGFSAWQADQWKDGRDYLRTYSERDWSALIGATIREKRCVPYPTYVCGGEPCSAGTPGCDDSCWQTAVTCYEAWVNGQSDGFIKATSQVAFRTQPDDGIVYLEALGANHLEQKNHPSVTNRLNEIWNYTGNDPVRQYFATLARSGGTRVQ